jgi:hypothetical protein
VVEIQKFILYYKIKKSKKISTVNLIKIKREPLSPTFGRVFFVQYEHFPKKLNEKWCEIMLEPLSSAVQNC